MFESIQNPVKGKGKEKDVGKRRAYVRVVTTLGGGLNLELFCEKVCSDNMSARPPLSHNYVYRPRKLVTTS
jgi:peptidyl-prolyl cis-trans isomerase-like protein 2